MKRVIIVHGYTGYPDKNWFPWLKAELEKLGVEVAVPQMPNTDAPQLSEWLPHLQQVVGEPNEDTYLVGHSLGCSAILRYLESLNESQKVSGIVLVAAFAESIHFSELDSFVTGEWNDEHIKAAANDITVINSDDDPHVPFEMAEHIRDRFVTKLIVLHGAKHISEDDGFTEVPEILVGLKDMMGL